MPMVDFAAELSNERMKRFTREEYLRLVNAGIFEESRVELLGGMIFDMSPQGNEHAEIVARLHNRFARLLYGRADVRSHSPFAIGALSAPEPDVAVIPVADYSHRMPDQAFLLIEVSQISLPHDRVYKAQLYAAAGVPELWIVDLVHYTFEVYRAPAVDGYRLVSAHGRGESVSPIAFPDVVIPVGEILPTTP